MKLRISAGLPASAIHDAPGNEALSLVLSGTGWQYTYNHMLVTMLGLVTGYDMDPVTVYAYAWDGDFNTVTQYIGTLEAHTDASVTVSGKTIDFDELAAIHLV